MKGARPLVFLGLLVSAHLLAAQEFTGRVTDETGAVLPRITVTVHKLDTGVDTPTQTTSTGDYTVPYLIPGHYYRR